MPTVSAFADVSVTDSAVAVAGIGSSLDVPVGDDIPNDPGWNLSPFRPSHLQMKVVGFPVVTVMTGLPVPKL